MIHPVEASLQMASDRGGDLTPRVYEILFERYPDMKGLFRRDTTDAVKGEMLARVFEAILDFVGDRRYAAHLIQCEVVTHAGYDVPPEVFGTFFGVVAAAVRETLDTEWTEEFERSWSGLLAELDYYVRHPDQSTTAARV